MTLVTIGRRSLLLLAAGIAINPDLRCAVASDNDYKPSWSVGQEWKVEVEKQTEPPSVPGQRLADFRPRGVKIIYHFEVEAVTEIDAEACTQIRIECLAVDGVAANDEVFYRVFMRKDGGTLKMVERLRRPRGDIEASRKFPSVPVDATDWVGFLPMAWPSFALKKEKHEEGIRRGADDEVELRGADVCSQKEQMITTGVAEEGGGVLQVALQKTADGGTTWQSKQIWVKGMPWWVEARHERGDQQWCLARLLKE